MYNFLKKEIYDHNQFYNHFHNYLIYIKLWEKKSYEFM